MGRLGPGGPGGREMNFMLPFINPWRACAARVTVDLVVCVCVCVCVSVTQHLTFRMSDRSFKKVHTQW